MVGGDGVRITHARLPFPWPEWQLTDPPEGEEVMGGDVMGGEVMEEVMGSDGK